MTTADGPLSDSVQAVLDAAKSWRHAKSPWRERECAEDLAAAIDQWQAESG